MRAALYARVSTRDKEQNPETQLRLLREHADRMGWEVTGEHVDHASASDLRGRRQWRALLDRIRLGGIDVIAVTKLDRAFRSVKDTHDGLDRMFNHRVSFAAITQPFDTTTSTGRLMLNILSVLAEFERDLIRERVQEGLARAKAEGKQLGRPHGSKDKRQRRKGGYYARYADRR